jgi:hypothetical protein
MKQNGWSVFSDPFACDMCSNEFNQNTVSIFLSLNDVFVLIDSRTAKKQARWSHTTE